jgi:hypothetical protein
MAEKLQRANFDGDDGGWGSLAEEPNDDWLEVRNNANGWDLEPAKEETNDTNGGWGPANSIENCGEPEHNAENSDCWELGEGNANGWELEEEEEEEEMQSNDDNTSEEMFAMLAARMAALEAENKLFKEQIGWFICPLNNI